MHALNELNCAAEQPALSSDMVSYHLKSILAPKCFMVCLFLSCLKPYTTI